MLIFSDSLPFIFHEWTSQNFYLPYQYIIKSTTDGNEEKFQLGDYKVI